MIANLELKLGIQALPAGNLRETKRISHALADITNLPPDTHQAYVGVSSFAHKAGLHASALKVNEELYSHIDPRLVGNDTRILVTEMAGRATVELKGRELGVDIASDPAALGARRRDREDPRVGRLDLSRRPTHPSSWSCVTSCPASAAGTSTSSPGARSCPRRSTVTATDPRRS